MKRYLLAAAGLAAALVVLVGFTSLVSSPADGAAPYVPREVVNRGVLPDDEVQVKGKEPGQEKGWEVDLYDNAVKFANPVKAFTRENLNLYLGDKTDSYLQHGFVKLTHGVYRPGLNDKPAVVADAYEMQTPLGAYGLFTQERNRADKMIEIGPDVSGHLGEKECVFWKGNYFVRVSLMAEVENAGDVLTMFAKKIAVKVTGIVCVPELMWFPPENRAVAGDRYVVRDLIGYACLGRGFSVEYDLGGSKATMFLAIVAPGTTVKAGDEVKLLDVNTSYLELRTALIKDGSVPQVLPGPWESGYRATESKLGRGLVARSGNCIVGIFGAPDEETSIRMVSSLVKALR